MLRGEAAAGYPAAQHAAYATLQDYLLAPCTPTTRRSRCSATSPTYDTTEAMIGHALGLRTLASILTQLGCPRTALAVLSSAVELVESSDQTGIRSMVFEATGRLLLHLGELPAARAACDIAVEAAKPMAVAEHMLSAAVLDLEIRACDPAQDVRADALDQLAVTTRTGFGLLARRCLALVDARDEPEGDAVRAAAAWQLRTSVSLPTALDAAGSVAEELDRLAPLHPHRRWMELRCLRERPWADQAFPQFLREPAGRIVGDSALVPRGDPFQMDESSAEDSHYGLTAFDDLLAALPYAPTNRPLRRQLIDAASTPDQLWQVVSALVPLTGAQVDSAAVQLDMANCARLLGNVQDAALLSDSGLRAHSTFRRTIFPMSPPEPVRLPLILGFAFDVLELGTPAEQAIDAVRVGLQGAPLLPRGLGNQPRLKFLGAKDEGGYASAATFAAEMSEMQMMAGHYNSLVEDSTDWWILEIVTAALTSRQTRRDRPGRGRPARRPGS